MKDIFELETVDDETLQNAIKQGKYNRAILAKIFNNVTIQMNYTSTKVDGFCLK